MKPNSILVQFWYNFCTIFIPDLYIFHLVFFIFTEITFPLLYFSIIYHFSSKPHSYKEGTLSGMLKVESYLDDFLFLILLMTFIHAHSLRAEMLLKNGEEVETFWAFDFDSCVRFSWSHCSGVVLGCVCFAHCSKIRKSVQFRGVAPKV